jgi:uncharacterized protein YkwD
MTLDPTINKAAQKYADKLAATKTFGHSGNKVYKNKMTTS